MIFADAICAVEANIIVAVARNLTSLAMFDYLQLQMESETRKPEGRWMCGLYCIEILRSSFGD